MIIPYIGGNRTLQSFFFVLTGSRPSWYVVYLPVGALARHGVLGVITMINLFNDPPAMQTVSRRIKDAKSNSFHKNILKRGDPAIKEAMKEVRCDLLLALALMVFWTCQHNKDHP